MLDHLYNLVAGQLENQFFSGGALLMILGGAAALMRNVPKHLLNLLKRRLITTVDITDHDQAFFWVRYWLSIHPYAKKARLLTVSTSKNRYDDGPDLIGKSNSDRDKESRKIEVEFSPAPGKHLIRFNGSWVLVTRTRKESEFMSGKTAYHETITLQTFSRNVVKELIQEAQQAAFPPEDCSISIMRHNHYDWHVAQKRDPRPFDSVILSGNTMDALVADIQEFSSSKANYTNNGIPYQKGYLLHGAPGNGKSSTVLAIASLLERDVYVLDPSCVSDYALSNLMSNLPEQSLLLVEDIDCIVKEDRKTDSDKLSFSGLLNALDGIYAPTGRILFMTTNHLDKLDPALIRPGRVDLKIEFKNADSQMAAKMFERLMPGHEELADSFGQLIGSSPGVFSMADIQNHLLKYRKNAVSAAHTIPNKDGV